MQMLKRFVVAGVAIVSGVTGATAGGDLRGSVKDDYSAAPVVRSWYVRADVGYAWQNSDSMTVFHPTLASSSVDNTWTIGGGIGRYFGRGLRGDVTYEWRGKTGFDAVSTSCCQTTTHFDVKSQVILANLYYDFRPGERFNPYVGVGVGAAFNDASGGSYPNNICGCVPYDGKSQWNVAWALMAGASLRLDGGATHGSFKDAAYVEPGRMHLDFGYRYINLGEVVNGPNHFDWKAGPSAKDFDAHELRVGLRYDLR